MMMEKFLGKFGTSVIYKSGDIFGFAAASGRHGDEALTKCCYKICRKQHYVTQKANSDEKKHNFTILISKVLREILKLRYILLGSMVGGGICFLKWEASFPDFTWFNNVLQRNEEVYVFLKKVAFFRNGFQTADEIEKKIKELQNKLYETHAEYKDKLKKIEEENKKLRRQLFFYNGHSHPKKKIHKSLLDMYSEVMDDLSDYDKNFQSQDHLPKIIVVGDLKAGKTSIIEMIVHAQIFPRRASDLIATVPIKVTVNEGPYHVAHFKGGNQEYDLTNEKDLEELHNQMEYYLLKSINQISNNVSNEIVSITVEGPRLHGMVLVNLPAIEGNMELKSSSKEYIEKVTKHYMSNQNAVILCIRDGSVSARESQIIDLVSQIDPSGKRTIHALNKVDLADNDCADPLKFEKILTGHSFPVKALGYFAVVAGRGRKDDSIRDIQQYEEDFFNNSKLFQNESIKSQLTTRNLSRALSENFWKMVRETVEQQADVFKAAHFNLKTEWKNSYRGLRELDRDELFDKARCEILDEIMSLREITVKQWEEMLTKRMWEKLSQYVFDNIYQLSAEHDDIKMFNTSIDIKLRQWANRSLPEESVEVGWEVLQDKLSKFILKDGQNENRDDFFDQLKDKVINDVVSQHNWESKANEVLRVIQLNALEDGSIQEKCQWDSAIKFLETSVREKLKEVENQIRDAVGPRFIERWLYWRYRTKEQHKKNAIKYLLERNVKSKWMNFLDTEEPLNIQNTLQENDIDTEVSDIINIWQPLNKKMFLKNRLDVIASCRNLYNDYHSGIEVKCGDVILFWRIQQMLKVTSNALRQQIMNREIQHLDKEVEEILEVYNRDPNKKYSLLTGRRVDLAEELKRIKKIHVKLEAFIQALNKEKRERSFVGEICFAGLTSSNSTLLENEPVLDYSSKGD